MALFTTAESKAVYEDPRIPEPKSVWNYFLGLVETPRGSGHQDIIKPKLVEWGKALGLEAFSDEIGNVIVRKPASAGAENWPGVCLQAHYDIVAVKLDEVKLEFKTDPLKPRIVPSPDEKYGKIVLQATGTSLGGDDGIGVATIFAILADKTLKHGPLEALITTDEETSMVGAEKLKPGTLKSQYLINVDSEESWRICIGCAGGFEEVLRFPLKKGNIEGVRILINLKGLKGGHSGVEIDGGRANAHKILAEAVDTASKATNIQNVLAAQYFVGGDKKNVIPPAARTSLIVPADKKDAFLANFEKSAQKLKAEWKTIESGMEFVVKADDAPASHLTYDNYSTQRTLDLVHTVPHGVLRWSPDVKGLVETSINLARVVLCDVCEDHEVRFEFFARSNDNGQMPFIHEQLQSLCRLGGGISSGIQNNFPGWLPDPSTSLLQVGKQVYKELNGADPEVYAIHAGLECGILQGSHPSLKCISVGPYLTGVHSPDETLYIETVPGTYHLIVGILAKLEK